MDSIKNIGSRVVDLVIKIISVKGSVFIIATVLLFSGKLSVYAWVIFAGVFVGVRAVEKMIRAMTPRKEG